MELQEQFDELTTNFNAMKDTHAAALADMIAENDRMKNHMNEAVAKEKLVKTEKRTLQEEFETFKTENDLGAEQTEKMNEIITQKLEKKQESFDLQFGEVNTKLADSENSYTVLKTRYDKERIGGALRKAAEKAGVLPDGIEDVISRAGNLFTINEEGGIESRDADGNIRKIGKKIASPDSFVDSLKDTASHLWPASKGSGAQGGSSPGTDDGVNPFAKDTINYTLQSQMIRNDPAKAERMKVAAAK